LLGYLLIGCLFAEEATVKLLLYPVIYYENRTNYSR
jgi:hypothetical protein